MSDKEIKELERRLTTDPFDMVAREKLSFYYLKINRLILLENSKDWKQRRHNRAEEILIWHKIKGQVINYRHVGVGGYTSLNKRQKNIFDKYKKLISAIWSGRFRRCDVCRLNTYRGADRQEPCRYCFPTVEGEPSIREFLMNYDVK